MNILYTLGTGSVWNNTELRYSLRSIEKYAENIGHVFIVGEDPGFLEGVTILPYPDKSKHNKEKNIFDKLVHACDNSWLGDEFVFFNDDHFLLQPLNLEQVPYWYSEPLADTMKRMRAGNTYLISLKNTILQLQRSGLPINNFDTHLPIIYSGNNLKWLKEKINWDLPYGYVIKSLYSNHFVKEGMQVADLKINKPHTVEDIAAMLHGRPAFSIGDKGLTPQLKALLKEKYPIPSRWEKV